MDVLKQENLNLSC